MTAGEETSLEELLRQRHEQIIECQELLASVRAAVSRAVADGRAQRASAREEVACLNGDEEIRNQLLTLAARADREIVTMHTRADWPVEIAAEVRAAEMDALRRGVAIRKVSPAAARSGDAILKHRPGSVAPRATVQRTGAPRAVAPRAVAPRAAAPRGFDVRLAEVLPADVLIVDHRTTLILLTPGLVDGKALLVRSPALSGLATAIFERIWDSARPIGGPAAPVRPGQLARSGDDGAPSDQERTLLAALGVGAKDEAAARELGVSVRTARRMIAELMRRLEARSRFQAGAVAVQKGWL